MNDLFDVKDKVIAITGGGGVLCGTMAGALAGAGAKIAVLDLIEAAAQKVVDRIKSDGGKAVAVKCDVLDKKSLEAAREKINAELGPIDILINGAGGNKKEATTSPDLSFFDLPAEALQFVFNLNFIGTLLPTQVFGKQMAEAGTGIILNISSMCAFSPLTKIPGPGQCTCESCWISTTCIVAVGLSGPANALLAKPHGHLTASRSSNRAIL